MRHLHDSTISELDFEQLPPALRRKFFSSLERLRLAQDGSFPTRSSHELPSFFTASITNTSLPTRYLRRPLIHLDNRLIRNDHIRRNRLRKKARAPPRLYLLTQQEVAQFASLPAAIQRKQYTREHQILLTSHISHTILDAADEAVYKQSWSHQSTFSSGSRVESSSSSLIWSEDGDTKFTVDKPSSMDHYESFKWLDEVPNLDLSLHDYHAAVTETAARQPEIPQKQPTRRSLSISNLSFLGKSSEKRSKSGRTSLPASVTHSRPGSSVTPTFGHRRNKGSVSSLDPGATHYQDPAARAKLRVYLASPQKFDEAVEFGFPSLQSHNTVPPSKHKHSPRATADHGMTFFDDDDTPSLSDGEDREFEDVDSPQTPSASAFSHGNSLDGVLDRAQYRPKLTRDFLDPYAHAPASSREMTLHMTLTRPDLRSPEEISTTRQINSVPIERPSLLLPMDNRTAFWDNLPDEESKVKKFFKKFRLRG